MQLGDKQHNCSVGQHPNEGWRKITCNGELLEGIAVSLETWALLKLGDGVVPSVCKRSLLPPQTHDIMASKLKRLLTILCRASDHTSCIHSLNPLTPLAKLMLLNLAACSSCACAINFLL